MLREWAESFVGRCALEWDDHPCDPQSRIEELAMVVVEVKWPA